MPASERLTALGIELPPVAAPVAAYVPATLVGNQIWTSGQLPFVAGELVAVGKAGGAVSPDDAAAAARTAALNAVAAAADLAGGVDNIRRVLKVVVFVASEPGFTAQPAVANGASNLLGDIFGESGVHVRSAVGVAVLPLDSAVEVELVVEV
ncbi:RidA family protein [Tessaracoccus sp. MC1865]|uniref:RidA family protein n=1 Tax=Tessaracoccus sp. MC1865 TaxID=2760310 RepID=UPI0016020CA5|nr:RidA family protein [Tessaracoccus sp. MC1865]MBB1484061.1 RidA family protein [Tessaracoccus sp. MC1865]QTO37097.1 RidA family protein [Tessaracoccus sp. MC1865]